MGREARQALAQRQAHKALVDKFRRSMHDKAKLAVLQYMEQHPQWSPEELKIVINLFLRKYGLNNRYVPPVTKAAVSKISEGESKVEMNGTNDPGTDATAG